MINIIELTNVSKTYVDGDKTIKALKNVNLIVNKGDMISIMGPSGSGKSTLLNIIGLMDNPSNGTLYMSGNLIESTSSNKLAKVRNKTVSFIFQDYNLIDNYDVYENVEIPLRYRGIKVKERKKLISEALKKLNILDKINSKVTKLSGGQRQRVAIARALVSGTDIIVADEPTGALDQKTGEEIMNIIKELNKEGKTIIIVTHDNKVASYCNRHLKILDGVLTEDN